MSKRNIAFTKPDEPAFLKRMKAEIGYKETCDVNTKFELPVAPEEDEANQSDEEQPQIVALKPGDLTKEEVELEKTKKIKEEEEKPADLKKKIIFKPKNKEDAENEPEEKKETAKKTVIKSLLSFDSEDDSATSESE